MEKMVQMATQTKQEIRRDPGILGNLLGGVAGAGIGLLTGGPFGAVRGALEGLAGGGAAAAGGGRR